MLWTQSEMNHCTVNPWPLANKLTFYIQVNKLCDSSIINMVSTAISWEEVQETIWCPKRPMNNWCAIFKLHDDSLSILSQIFLISPSISSPLDAVFFGGIIDPWIHKGPITAVFESLYSYTVMQRQQTISKASNMDCLAAQPSAFGSPCCRQEDAY